MQPDTTDMTPVSALANADLQQLADEPTSFISAFRWCRNIHESFLAFGVVGIVGVFLFRIEPALIGVDEMHWVIVGDLPPAYLVCDKAPDWREALRCYVFEMRRWVEAARAGSSLHGIIPVRANPTREHADMLASRLDCIQDYMIDDLPFDEDANA
jgi:hypothetical protein